jgi:hypothetical protein
MKKLFTVLVLLLSLTMYSQTETVKQITVDYNSIYISKDDIHMSFASAVHFNYPNKGEMLIELESGSSFKFKMISQIKEGVTTGGYKYKSAYFKDDTNKLVLVQVFTTVPVIRLTFEDDESIELSQVE